MIMFIFFILEFVVTVTNACSDKVQKVLQHKIDNMKRSILYDMRKSFQDLQNTLSLNISQQDASDSMSSIKQIIGITLPTRTVEDFQALDSSTESNEKNAALVSYFYSSDYFVYKIFVI